ncbi:hypothetical protein GDO81_020760 [Engystomops pustulosus]|uniref:Uncharacterized protein n=1 Tax=Engystomops pustulosus TaxID=76066 RepID=A0AAV6YS98_ENGPU|nr:hypothetical protein GDO81_020760 [Engystomops pustulosus]
MTASVNEAMETTCMERCDDTRQIQTDTGSRIMRISRHPWVLHACTAASPRLDSLKATVTGFWMHGLFCPYSGRHGWRLSPAQALMLHSAGASSPSMCYLLTYHYNTGNQKPPMD